MRISVVIPVFNSQNTLHLLVNSLLEQLPSLGLEYEIVLVNDASSDDSWKVICELAQQHSVVTGINLTRNFGQQSALLAGIRLARYEVTVTMDDDLQNPCEEIQKLLHVLQTGYDVVYGTPVQRQHSLYRNLASQITKWVLKHATRTKITCSLSPFRAFHTKLRDCFSSYNNPFVSIDMLLSWSTTKLTAIPVNHEPRYHGSSNYNFFKLVTHALNMVTSFSTLPLRIASIVGLAITLLGFCTLAYVLTCYFIKGAAVPGFAFLVSLISVFSGAQMFTLGIIGEYLARIYIKNLGYPPYIIAERTSLPAIQV